MAVICFSETIEKALWRVERDDGECGFRFQIFPNFVGGLHCPGRRCAVKQRGKRYLKLQYIKSDYLNRL